MKTVTRIETLDESAVRFRLSEHWEGYDHVLVVAEKPMSLAARTRVYAARDTGSINIGIQPLGYLILDEHADSASVDEALERQGYSPR
jgi:predicted DNA-binding helix-hairpin-helix protein